MKVLIKKPGHPWYEAEVENELHALQSIVDGYIEAVRLDSVNLIICNEEMLLRGDAKYNTTIGDCQFFGTIFVVGEDGEEFCDYDREKFLQSMQETGTEVQIEC